MNLRLGRPKGAQPSPSTNADHPLHHTLVRKGVGTMGVCGVRGWREGTSQGDKD